MPIIYVIEQLIDKKWVGIQTNFFNSTKSKKISGKVARRLSNLGSLLIEDGLEGSEMTRLINKLSEWYCHTTTIHEYIRVFFDSMPPRKRSQFAKERLSGKNNTHTLIGMPPEFNINDMRFIWWDGDYACTPVENRIHPLRNV